MAAVGETNTLQLFNSSSPGITNTYAANRDNRFAGLIGAGGGYRFDIRKNLTLSLGLQGSYLKYGTAKGTVHPLVNVAPDFDTLDYSYHALSYLLMVNPSLIFFSESRYHLFATLGLGIAWNRLSGYNEVASLGSTASPGLFMFRKYMQTAFAYASGIGVECMFNQHYGAQVGYQYIHAGNAQLNTLTDQETSARLQSGTLSAHLVTINFLFA